MVDFSAITAPVERLVATAQNGLEVLRYGGLETGAVPSPFESCTTHSLSRCGLSPSVSVSIATDWV